MLPSTILQLAHAANSLQYFGPPHVGEIVVNATVAALPGTWTPENCASQCVADHRCIAFTVSPAWCNLSTWSNTYAVTDGDGSYYFKIQRLDRTPVVPRVTYALDVPTAGVSLTPGSLFANASRANLAYLLQFPVDDMLYWFRRRKGVADPPGSSWGCELTADRTPDLQ